MLNSVRSWRYKIILALIVFFGGFFAMWGADYGLPVVLHPNEWTIVEPAVRMVENRTLIPDVFYRPDHLLIIINSIIYRVMAVFFGVEVADIGNGRLYLAARLLTGLFAVGSILVAYITGKRYAAGNKEDDAVGKRIGLVCAFLFAFLPIYVREAHYATPDIPTVFFMLLFIYVSLGYMQRPNLQNILLMSAVTAGFITIKYPGAILVGMIALCVLATSIRDSNSRRFFSHGFFAGGGLLAATFIISPILFIRFHEVYDALVAEARDTHLGYDGLGWFGNIWYYFTTYVAYSGVIFLVFLAIGIYAIFQKRTDDVSVSEPTPEQSPEEKKEPEKSGFAGFLRNNPQIMTALPILSGFAFWVALSYMSLHWERWALPMYVSPLLISGIGVVKGYDFIKSQTFFTKRRRLCTGIFAAILAFSGLNLISGSAANMTEFLLPDTRIVSRDFAEANNITPDNTLYENYTTFEITFHGDALVLYRAFDRVGETFNFRYDHIDYIIISSNMYNRYRAEPERYAQQIEIYEFVAENFLEIKRFEVAYRNNSVIDIINIFRNISYLICAANNGMSGHTLIFYEIPT